MTKEQALAEYQRVCALARAEHARATEAADGEYERVEKANAAEFERLIAPAKSEEERIRAEWSAEYDRARLTPPGMAPAPLLPAPVAPSCPYPHADASEKLKRLYSEWRLAQAEYRRVEKWAREATDQSRDHYNARSYSNAMRVRDTTREAAGQKYELACKAAQDRYQLNSAPPPPASPSAVMTAKAGGFTYADFLAAGWNNSQLRAHGYIE